MRIVKAIVIFYQKLIVPTLIFSGLLGLTAGALSGEYSLKFMGASYIFSAPLFHYFICEVRDDNEYYFYYNLGLSKLILWMISMGLSLVIGLIFLVL
jgi:hypothetical protein